jgi:hypothetical protein
MERSLCSLASILLSGAGSSLAKSDESSIRHVYSPRGDFIEKIIARPGQRVDVGEPILKLSTLEWDRELQKLGFQIRILDIASERMTDDYVNTYVLGPMEAMVNYRKTNVDNYQFIFDYTWSLIGVGDAEVKQAQTKVDDAKAEMANAVDALEIKKRDIAKQKADKETDRLQLVRSVELIKNLIKLSTILAPRPGRFELKAFEGVFVEKGDLLFELAII